MNYEYLKFGITQNGLENSNLIDILKLMLANPFGGFNEMRINDLDYGEEYNVINTPLLLGEIETLLLKGPLRKIKTFDICNLQHSKTVEFRFDLAINRETNWIQISFIFDPAPYIELHGKEKCLTDFYKLFRALLPLFPVIKSASAFPVVDREELRAYKTKLGIKEQLLPCVGYDLRWIKVTSPGDYHGFYTKEILLNAPAYHIEEWDNDVIYTEAFKDPYSLEDLEVQRQYAALHNYYNDNATLDRFI